MTRTKRFRRVGFFLAVLWAIPVLAADFSFEPVASAPTEGVPEAVQKMIRAEGFRVKTPDGKLLAEYWGRKTPFEGKAEGGFGVLFSTVPEGAFLGVVRFPEGGSDFRGQTIAAGVYTLRYVLHPQDGNHMGVAASRDFAAFVPAQHDTEPTANLAFSQVVELSRKGGNPHPTVARVEPPKGDQTPNLWEDDYGHWVLDLKAGDEVIGFVVYGHSEE